MNVEEKAREVAERICGHQVAVPRVQPVIEEALREAQHDEHERVYTKLEGMGYAEAAVLVQHEAHPGDAIEEEEDDE